MVFPYEDIHPSLRTDDSAAGWEWMEVEVEVEVSTFDILWICRVLRQQKRLNVN